MKSLFLSLLAVSLGFSIVQARTVYVNGAATGTNTGASWANAHTSLATAITSALDHDTLWVAAGTYTPGTARMDAFEPAVANLHLFGGFAGTETSLSQRNVSANVTILSGDIGTAGVQTDNSYNVVRLLSTVSLFVADGFVIERGYAVGSGVGIVQNRGGAVTMASNSSAKTAVIRNCELRRNSAVQGGVLSVYTNGTMKVENCWIHDNAATFNQPLGLNDDEMVFTNCFIDTRRDLPQQLIFQGQTNGSVTRMHFCTVLVGTGAFSNEATGDHYVLSHSSFMSNSPTATIFFAQYSPANTANKCYVANYQPIHLTQTNPIARPLFVNVNDTTPAGFVQLGCSPGVNVATQGTYDSLASASSDLLGNPRNVSNMVDIGAIETQGLTGSENIVTGNVIGDTSICLLQTHVFKPQATSLYGGLKYQWLEDGGTITIADSLSINGQPFYNNGTTFSYIAFNTCGRDTSPEFHVFVKIPGTPNLSIPGQTVCEGEIVTLTVAYTTPGNGPAGNQTAWYHIIGTAPYPQVGTGDSLVISAISQANVGYYQYVFDHECLTGPAQTSGYGLVNVLQKYTGPLPTLAQQGSQLVASQDFGVYIWFLNGVPIDTTSSDLDELAWNLFTPTIAGTYTVGSNVQSCGDTLLQSNPIVFPFVSVDNKQLNALTISPNPAKERVRIDGLTAPAHCRISNMLGQEVWHTLLNTDGLLTIPASVAPGLYTVQVEGYGGLRITLN